MAAQPKCPTCQRPILWTEEYPCRPFCSERCRLIDLGAWLSERHAIPGSEPGPGEGGVSPEDSAAGS